MARIKVEGYELAERIGTGANSVIYKARRKGTQEVYAVKVVPRRSKADDKYVDQVTNEFAVASRFDHPNLVRVFDLQRIQRFWRLRQCNLVLEWVDGFDLEVVNRYPVRQLVSFYIQVAQGLGYMHGRGFIHADIKPANIIVHRQTKTAKIVDFGITRRIGVPKGRVQGTMNFIAPEQMLKGRIDERTDIYNLGASFYNVFTNRHLPRPVMTGLKDLQEVNLKERPTPASALNPDVPGAVSELIQWSTQHRPEERPKSMDEVIGKLKGVLLELQDAQNESGKPEGTQC